MSHRKLPSGNSITNKIFGPIRHAVQGVVDVDPERTRRDTIGKTRESIGQLEQAQVASERDVKDASASVLKDLRLRANRFGFEPEITAKLVKRGCRIYEVPISYHGRTYREGKKITWRDGLAALWHILKFRFFD